MEHRVTLPMVLSAYEMDEIDSFELEDLVDAALTGRPVAPPPGMLGRFVLTRGPQTAANMDAVLKGLWGSGAAASSSSP